MQKRKLNTQGFGLVGILAVVLVVVLVGFSGWYVWHKNHSKATNSAVTHRTTEIATSVAPSAEGTVIATADKKVQVTIPETWRVNIDSNNQSGDQVISINKNTHMCDKYNQGDCSYISPCLTIDDEVSCIYEATFQPKALDPQKDGTWGLRIEKTDKTLAEASQEIYGDLTSDKTVEKSTNKINGYETFYTKVKGGDCSVAECYVDIGYIIKNSGYLLYFSNREQYTNHSANPVTSDYSSYSADFAKIVGSLKLNF